MHRFITNLLAVVTSLSLKDKFDKKELTKEDQEALIKAYNKAHGASAFTTDFSEFQAEEAAQDKAVAEALAKLAGITGVPEASAQTPEGINQILAAFQGLQEGLNRANATIERLSQEGLEPKPQATVTAAPSVVGAHTAEYAFGIQHDFFAASHRYNAILINGRISGNPTAADRAALETEVSKYAESLAARVNELQRTGRLALLRQANVDISQLSTDTEIGTRQFTIRQDMVIARIVKLPSLAGLFNTVSNVQSGQVITNVLFSEISQAYQEGEVFKGGAKFQPEKAIVDDAMAKIRFKSLKDLETSYLNYLNREGSDPVKWTLIEWLIISMATQIANERIRRSILGCRVEPVSGKESPTNFASTGVVYRLIHLVEDNKLLPFTDDELADYDATNIGDVLVYFVKKMSARRPADFQNFTIYLNEAHRAMFMEWYRNKYGKDTDFSNIVYRVPNYGNPIKWVPAMGNLKLIFATIEGNIELLQNVPGEEYKMQFERHLETVYAYSFWKEGAAVGFVGPNFKNRAELLANKGRDQYVFINWPVITAKADATTVDVETEDLEDLGFLIKTSANSQETVLTDILNAKEGVVYRIECGSTENATTIAKSGKFSEVDAWAPAAVGEYINLYYNSTESKFHEVSRG